MIRIPIFASRAHIEPAMGMAQQEPNKSFKYFSLNPANPNKYKTTGTPTTPTHPLEPGKLYMAPALFTSCAYYNLQYILIAIPFLENL
jgi:hypothetical protein